MTEGFQTFDHTGDLGLEVRAATPDRLFALAAEALLAQVARPRAPGAAPEVEAEVALAGDDDRDLFVHWLNTALLEAELRHAVWTRVEVLERTATSLRARLAGPRLDRARMETLREVKAVSHHFLELDLTPGACRCRLVLDL
jgi:SHS2 domain-containing protein